MEVSMRFADEDLPEIKSGLYELEIGLNTGIREDGTEKQSKETIHLVAAAKDFDGPRRGVFCLSGGRERRGVFKLSSPYCVQPGDSAVGVRVPGRKPGAGCIPLYGR